jgi:hypothetical protein
MLDKKFFIDFIKKNSHKFVFYSYPGGAGGEFVCNYLAYETDYFYNKQIVSKSFDKPGENRSSFEDGLFAGAFTNLAQAGVSSHNYDGAFNEKWKDSVISRWNPAYDIDYLNKKVVNTDGCVVDIDDEIYYSDIVEKLFNYKPGSLNLMRDTPGILNLEAQGANVDDIIKDICNNFTNQDKPYLIKTHGISKDFMYFKDSKFIELNVERESEIFKWSPDRYVDLLHTIKVIICPAITYKEKDDLISRVIWRLENALSSWGDNKLDDYLALQKFDKDELYKKAINYIGEDFLLDDEKELYSITAYALLIPEFYRINLNDYNIDELNVMMSTNYLHRGFVYRQETYLRNMYTDVYSSWFTFDYWGRHPQWKEIFDPTLQKFEDLFNGEWVEKAFGIDRVGYEKAFNNWHNKNVKLLEKYGIMDFSDAL